MSGNADASVSKEKTLSNYELQIIIRDGTVRWAELAGATTMIGGRPAGIVSVFDISERRLVEDAYCESEELYTRLVNTIPDVVIRTDLEGKILFINDQALKLSGYNIDEMVARSMYDFFSPEDRDKVILHAFLMVKARLSPREYKIRRKDGKDIPFEVNGDVLRARDGAPFGLVFVVCRNISERKQSD